MGMSTGGDDNGLMAEINVTPFVDVMLVLLIIFMVTAPMMTVGVQVDLPNAAAPPMAVEDQEPLVLGVKADGSWFWNETPRTEEQMAASLKELAKNDPTKVVFIKADAQVPYERVAKLLATCTSLGVTKVGMVTELGGEG